MFVAPVLLTLVMTLSFYSFLLRRLIYIFQQVIVVFVASVSLYALFLWDMSPKNFVFEQFA